MKEGFDRHDLVFLSKEGRRQALAGVEAKAVRRYGEKTIRKIIRTVPGIVRYQGEEEEPWLALGFSWHEKADGQRIRIATRVEAQRVFRRVTPWELRVEPYLEMSDGGYSLREEARPVYRACEQIIRLLAERGIVVGIFGSLALELATGLPYVTETSDLDLIVRWDPVRLTEEFYDACRNLAEGVRLDLEVYFPGWGSVKAAEWFSGEDIVLVKGYRRTEIVERGELEAAE
ncbi:MAG: malonate decarboxylase holo-[acyl-carrier-protein] synthase [Lachnospiraceae bacterium]|nr:malonate decarboxylase holo-[acyl-carrier-protein] synthase [Lachnospiraceae bacterium]